MRLIVGSFLALSLFASVAKADIVVSTLPANNQANMTADVGQTFTTGTLVQNQLDTIQIEGPQVGSPGTAYTIELWTDTDGDHSTWDPGTLVGESINSAALPNGTLVTYQFSGEVLSDNTVYGFTYTDGDGNRINARMGLTNANAISDGTLFSAGNQVFGDAFDTSMRITTVPEPTGAVILGFIGLVAFRRRNRS